MQARKFIFSENQGQPLEQRSEFFRNLLLGFCALSHPAQFKTASANQRVCLDSDPISRYIYAPGHQRKLYPMGFFSFLVLLVIAYLLWRVTDQLPDLIFRLSEVQRDVAELRRALSENDDKATNTTAAPAAHAPAAPAAAPATPADDASEGNA